MKRILLLFVLISLAPGPAGDPLHSIREGNAAFNRRELAIAAKLYDSATDLIDDPGLAAFNRAAVHATAGDWRDAELEYLRCLADRDCPAGRRAFAEYNRGVCLLNRGGPAAIYRVAIQSFETVLDTATADPAFVADAMHNLELAKLLWQKARLREAKPPPAKDLPPEEERRPEPPRIPPPESNDPGGIESGPANTAAANDPAGSKAGNGQPTPTNQQTPGAGTLAPLPDDDRVVSRPPADTRAYLAKAAARLDAERRANAELLAGPDRKGVKDW